MIGRRVGSFSEIELPGDYYGPTAPGIARDDDAPGIARSIHHVNCPPHTFRECADGSLEIRASIGDTRSGQPELGSDGWHGYLNEGHEWVKV